MNGGFRQSMAWLHTWGGLVCGWLLCAIFLTGTLSVFRAPITRWMEDRPLLAAAALPASPQALEAAAHYLGTHAAGARLWRIDLPVQPGDALLLAWRPAGSAGGRPRTAALDPGSGAPLPQPWGRDTEGGRHFMTFHYSLYGGMPGFWLVGVVAAGMLVALVSGIAVHRRIFSDFFTFRPGKGQRSWLDAHNATGVLALPFLFMIVYTGLAIFYASYMPWPLQAAYGGGPQAHERFQRELSPPSAAPRRPAAGRAAGLQPIAPLVQQAQARMGLPAHRVIVERPGDAAARVRVFGQAPAQARTLHTPASSVDFDGAAGTVLQVQGPQAGAPARGAQLHGAMEALHLAGFGGWTMKWLYFLSGLAGTALLATGTLLFGIKRRHPRRAAPGHATYGLHRAVDALNVCALAGTALACIAFLWLNRLLPAALAERADWEIRGFMAVWAATLAHAALRPAARAWAEQLSAAAVLCLGLPLLNWCTTGQQVLRYALAGDGQRAAVELVAVALGCALACMAWRVRRSR